VAVVVVVADEAVAVAAADEIVTEPSGFPCSVGVPASAGFGEPGPVDAMGVFWINLMKEESIEIEGSIQTVLPGTMFRVELDNKHLVLATISGKMRKRWVRLTVGDRVKMEMSPYDMDKARIIWRLQDQPRVEGHP